MVTTLTTDAGPSRSPGSAALRPIADSSTDRAVNADSTIRSRALTRVRRMSVTSSRSTRSGSTFPKIAATRSRARTRPSQVRPRPRPALRPPTAGGPVGRPLEVWTLTGQGMSASRVVKE